MGECSVLWRVVSGQTDSFENPHLKNKEECIKMCLRSTLNRRSLFFYYFSISF